MPEMQYVDGRFRHRLPDSVSVGANDIVVPRRAAVFETEDAFDLGIANTEILESILASNRFVVRPIDGLPPDVLGWTFFTVDRAPTSLITLLPSGGLGSHWPHISQSPLRLRFRWPNL